MIAPSLQSELDLPPLDLYVPESEAFLILTAPCDEAGDYLFDYLTNYRRLEGYGFGAIGKKPGNPRVVWIRAQRRSRWFREYIWSAGQVVELIDEVWEEVGSKWISVPEPMAPASPMPAPAPIIKPVKSPLWGEDQMAQAMGLDPVELHRRLDDGLYHYKYTQRCDRWDKQGNNLQYATYEYLFNDYAQRWNEEHVGVIRKIKQRR